MPHYNYIARTQSGEKEEGNKYSENKKSLARSLRKKDLTLISAEHEEKGDQGFSFNLSFFGVSLQDKLMFTRNLRVMIGAGMPLPRSLRVISSQVDSKKLKEAIKGMAKRIVKGDEFSETLRDTGIFSDLYCSMIEIGEETGNLETVLKNLAFHMKRTHDMKSKIKGALIYPAVIITAMIGIGILMLVMVVPQLAETFKELDLELPATTRFVIGLGGFLSSNFLWVALVFIGLIALFRWVLNTDAGKKAFDSVILKVPIISSIVIKTNSASTVRTLGILTSSGVPIVRSLNIISDSLSNFYFSKAIRESAENVKKGANLSESLAPHQVYPSLVIQMLKVGEETGETSEVLDKLADFYESQVTRSTKNLASIVEPILMLLIGGIVGFFAVSMIQPMYSMISAL
ncbi:MAG: type II secretion system F family protein [Candidatus Paceibacterota bacterium]